MIGGAPKLTGLETLVFEEQPTKPFRSASVNKNQVGLMKRKSEYSIIYSSEKGIQDSLSM